VHCTSNFLSQPTTTNLSGTVVAYSVKQTFPDVFDHLSLDFEVLKMRSARHTGRAGQNDDKKFDFSSPDSRGSGRTASHRYLPSESKGAAVTASAGRADEHFSSEDFKARWWPAPDSFQ
jgi:hypothetical protein